MSEEKVFNPEEDLEVSSEKKERKVVGACPICGSEVYEYGWGWGCSKGKDNCDFTLNRVILGHVVTDQEISDYLIKGSTELITDFVSKEKGTKFSARLTFREGKFAFDFPNRKKEEE